ncbi:ABC transporter substrate-binding protein [Marinobacter sp. M3C]|jgi:ABC transporter substrate binding protein (PQQ-dependent alcohol dehydrogenase system)|uniref:ABC transporter substrate-binding protein n=1 Tax=unclassified Marinobacter TaxID=83889 RepID=UPI00200F3769|nr:MULTISPECIES: ABC transporter substrate-binding protein [unclassified Marinobacter]MCL1477779.1 ABC transporter substrate-binding protein [Marinobacter sp.]MCL1481254.1 ABC transporter substrate-binding protein [Marinobacter sp.]MCL1487652.1 ABC transporter substrate-binding protein [Marinobacter sp.]UQG57473.1 ABC transporter substrate-binding protein [Marinobacter sp. M4C]UQG61350.1 ABC transporter substrate-binding protein [Marinobacter sp. M3C]
MFRFAFLIVTFLFTTLTAMLSFAADTVNVKVGYVQWTPDSGPVLSNVLPEPEDAGLRGAELAMADNSTTGKFMGHRYELATQVADSEQAAIAAFENLQQQGVQLFVINAPASTLAAIMDKAAADTLVFNAGAADDALRTRECHNNLLHTIPSYAMLTDALGQWLQMRRWNEVFLITGPTEADVAWANAFRRSAKRFGIDIVEDKPWTFDTDLRRTASKELPLFTQAKDYDAVVVADVRGDFGEYVPFNTWLPRPVVGTQGMSPVAWHRVVESWGAAQLQSRFQELAGRDMNSADYAAWAAVRSVGTAVTQAGSADASSVRQLIFSDRFQLAAFKGRKLTYRQWNGQLRQPIPLVHPRGLVATAPFEGFIHPLTEMDTLGFDEPESTCRING